MENVVNSKNNNPSNRWPKLDEFEDPPPPCSSQCREYVRRENRLHSQVGQLLEMNSAKLNMQKSEILSLRKKKSCIKCNQDDSANISDKSFKSINLIKDYTNSSHIRLDENEDPPPTCSIKCQEYARRDKRLQNKLNKMIEIVWAKLNMQDDELKSLRKIKRCYYCNQDISANLSDEN